MAKFFFHLRDGTDTLLDPDGVELAPSAVPAAALRAARDCIAHDAKAGRINLNQRITVEDEAGAAVHVIEFVDAVEITMPPELTPGANRVPD